VRARYGTSLLALVLAIPLLLASCTRAPVTDAPVLDAPKTYALTIIGTADLQGMLEPTMMKLDADGDGKQEEVLAGGIARIATLIRQIQDETENPVVVVSAGDDLMNRYFHTFKGQAIFGLMSDAGYELYAFGNHEFDKGPDVLAAAVDSAAFECICTDLAVEGTPLEGRCVPWLIKDYEGLKVGFFSLMTEGFPYVTSGKSVEITGTNLETAHRAVRELRDAGAQLVVGLTHVGYGRDLEIAKSVPGIDVIFGGHSHEYAKTAYRMGGTIVVNGGEKGPYLVRLDLTTDENGKLDLANVRSELIPVTDAVPADEDIEAKLAAYQEQFPEAIVLGRTDVPWDMTKDAFRGKKVYQPGPVTDVMLHEIDEFSNYAFSMDLSGTYILEVLERSAASFGGGGLLHAAGLRYVVDLTRTEQELTQGPDGSWSVSVPGERVVEVTVMDADGEWKPLDPDHDYSVLSNSFIVQHEGDGYFWFKRYATNPENTYSTFYSILAEIACNEGVLNPEAPDGRLKAVQ